MSTSLDLQVGHTARFGTDGLGRAGLLGGWANNEESHVWNDGVTAALLVSDAGYPPPLMVGVSGQPYIPQPDWRQDITLYANGWFAGFWRLVDDVDSVLQARIEPEWWIIRNERAWLRLTFLLPNSVSPAEASGGGDGRQLAFCFRTIGFVAATG
jgi:hypothetical protein